MTMHPDIRHGFTSIQPAATWEEGLICGNGTIGANALSQPLDETVIFTHERLFLPCGSPVPPPEMGPRLFEIRRLIDRGLYGQASQLAFDLSGQSGFLYPDPFVPAFDLRIHTESNSATVADYGRSVDFQTGEAVVRWSGEGGAFERRLFVSRAHGIGVMQLTGPDAEGFSCRLSLGPRRPGTGIDARKVERSEARFRSHVRDVAATASADLLTYRCRYAQAYPGSIQHLLGMTRVVANGGTCEAFGDTLTLTGANHVLLLVGIEPLYDLDDDGVASLTARLAAAPRDYATLLDNHAEIHGRFFNRVRLDLGGGADHALSTEALLEKSTNEQLNTALLEKQFDAGRHNIISCTGELPPALQGIWGGTYVPDWAGDFTHNGNVPSAIASLLMGHTPELMRSYTSYLEYLVPYLELNALRMFNARGIVLPSRSSTHGFNNALAPKFAGGFWVAGAAWAAHFFYDYWLYTGDRQFLVDHALPFMEKAAAFFEDYLYEGNDGRFVFSPTQSPENTPGNSNSQASFNATMDVAAAKELLENLITASSALEVNADRIPHWREMVSKMPDYMVNDEGIIREWLTPRLTNRDSHRHSSHLYALYDGMPDEIATRADLQAAFKRTIRNKLDRHWADNATGFMSFGLVQLGQAAASLGDGELAYACLVHLVNRYWLANLASMHNHRSLFNMDISGGMPAVVMKMLVTSSPGHVVLLPALPAAWPSGTIEGVLCRGQVEVRQLTWRPGEVCVTLLSGCHQELDLQVPYAIRNVTTSDQVLVGTSQDNRQGLSLAAGQEITLDIAVASEESESETSS